MKSLYYLFKDILNFIDFLLIPKEVRKTFLISKEEQSLRWNQCENCPNIKNSFFQMKRCGICGCFLKFKIPLSFEECPDIKNKWETYESR